MNKKELAGNLLSLLREGRTDEMEMVCEAMDRCRIHAQGDRAKDISPVVYTKEEADMVINNGVLVSEVLKRLREDDFRAVEVVLQRYV